MKHFRFLSILYYIWAGFFAFIFILLPVLIQDWNDVPVATAYRLFDDGAGQFGLLNNNGSIRDSGFVLAEYADGNDSNLIEGTAGRDTLNGTAKLKIKAMLLCSI